MSYPDSDDIQWAQKIANQNVIPNIEHRGQCVAIITAGILIAKSITGLYNAMTQAGNRMRFQD